MGSLRARHDWATSLLCIGEGNGNPLQCSCLENPRDGGAWWAAVYGVAQSWTRLTWLSNSSRNYKAREHSWNTTRLETTHWNSPRLWEYQPRMTNTDTYSSKGFGLKKLSFWMRGKSSRGLRKGIQVSSAFDHKVLCWKERQSIFNTIPCWRMF